MAGRPSWDCWLVPCPIRDYQPLWLPSELLGLAGKLSIWKEARTGNLTPGKEGPFEFWVSHRFILLNVYKPKTTRNTMFSKQTGKEKKA